MTEMDKIQELVEKESQFVDKLLGEVGKVIVGQRKMIERILIGLLCKGHILLEGVPGLAKTLTIKTFCDSIHVKFQRIQFTPDLLPADIIGTLIYDQKTGNFTPKKGPIFANLILADEINRAPGQGAERAAGGHAGAAGDHRRGDLQARRAVPGAGHAKPDRAGRHLSAARGPG